MLKIVVVLAILVMNLQNCSNYKQWQSGRKPSVMGDKIPFRSILPNRRIMQRRITQIHNFFRMRVTPKAANMLRMKWHRGAALAAQRWSQNCYFLLHDNVTGRHIPNYGACGQNIFIATDKVPWFFAINTWYLEKYNFTYGSPHNDLNIIGHYTQMVWATTHQVGCGLSKCLFPNSDKTFYNYICNYCPIGNRPSQLGRPYRRGRPCSVCRKNCSAQKLCTNACHFADLWVNCQQLYKVWPEWLCFTKTEKGRERARHCKATCLCKNKLHD